MRRPRLRRPRLPRPSPRGLATALAILGVAGAAAILLVPVDAAYADDPLLRYGRFAGTEPTVTDIECGTPVTNLLRRSEESSFHSVARAGACREAASRRAATAEASGGVVALLGLIGATAARQKAGG